MDYELIDHQEWHTEEDFPQDLDAVCALTHMGMYFEWMAQTQLLHPAVIEQLGEKMTQLQQQQLNGRDILEHSLGRQLLLSFFNEFGRRFTEYYYTDDEEGYGQFMSDYYTTLRVDLLPSLYHVDNSRAAYDAVASQFDLAYLKWQASLKEHNS
ncbi:MULTISPECIES: hypothetical protein [Vitreoscilla]|uniref:Cell surface protein n=1 Tax=Vitreoscilla stercoraria TaxID=61 RepID=A0ABY4EAX6_VITST|nr:MULTISPECIES: hypothetical protein [Vitreoscilla]AUZ05697.1 hypothetical protein ADP71_23370 [Vitreoscilla sp. C1]UOO92903.1 cell surface protein [Vitreoscilla stercoraria]